ncbi:MAG: hypothetical protein IKT53_08930 [Bacteroidaceae bacterium]|nr:hypothetical protein [Bacteroidaceae bacterium]
MKKMICAVAVMVVSATMVVGLCSFVSHAESDAPCEGKHCTYTVGCGCSGFSPKSGDVWEKAYCRRCGHHRNYHK